MAYTNGFIEGTSDYEDLNTHQRIQLLQFLCDAQFTRNYSFKNHVAKIPEDDYDSRLRDSPIGLDRQGQRYWLLQVGTVCMNIIIMCVYYREREEVREGEGKREERKRERELERKKEQEKEERRERVNVRRVTKKEIFSFICTCI